MVQASLISYIICLLQTVQEYNLKVTNKRFQAPPLEVQSYANKAFFYTTLVTPYNIWGPISNYQVGTTELANCCTTHNNIILHNSTV